MKARYFLFSVVFVLATMVGFAETPYKSNVTASFYADKFHGQKTANGETFNMYEYTAAHRTLPFNTFVKVTNLANGKSVIVRINDRGPFTKDREIDLSKAAAIQLDMIQNGTAQVSIEIIESAETTAEELEQDDSKYLPGTTWDIQVGAFGNAKNAEAFAKELLRAGFTDVAYQRTSSVTRVVIRNVPAEKVKEIENELTQKGFKEHFARLRSEMPSSASSASAEK